MKHLRPAAVLLCFCLLGLAGCGSLPENEYYDVSCPAAEPVPARQRVQGSVTVRPFGAMEAYSQPEIAYRSDPYRLHYDHYRKWAASPGTLADFEFAQYLSQSQLFDTVVHSSFPARTQYQIFGRVVDFYELNKDDEKFAVLTLEITLTDSSEEPVFSLITGATVKAPATDDLSGLARAMSLAMQEVFSDVLEETARRLASPQPKTKNE